MSVLKNNDYTLDGHRFSCNSPGYYVGSPENRTKRCVKGQKGLSYLMIIKNDTSGFQSIMI